jgi:predicted phosphodiesterase
MGSVLCFGGPYSNLQATKAVLDEAARLGIPPGQIVCTGDVVAYCADPAATLDLVMASDINCIMGNCEENLAGEAGDCGCGFEPGTACDVLSRGWFTHAARALTPAHRAWMAALPRRLVLTVGGRRLAVVHGSADAISRFLFASAPDAALAEQVAVTGCDGVIAGHCGLPFTRRVQGALWHNPGAIGMPANDGTPRVWFSVLTPVDGQLRVEHRALEYDWAGAMAAMRAAEMAEDYASALGTGLWPSIDVLPAPERERCGVPIEPVSIVW